MFTTARVVIGLAVLLLLQTAAHACPGCSMASGDFKCLPGMWLLNPTSGVAIFFLISFIERPFLTWAGVKKNALAHSLIGSAICMTLLAIGGAFVISLTWRSGELVMIPWIAVTVAGSAWIKWARLRRRSCPGRETVRYEIILLGNLVSIGVVFLLPQLQSLFGFSSRYHASRVVELQLPIFCAFLLASIAALILSNRKTSAEAILLEKRTARGFEVLAPVEALPIPNTSAPSVAVSPAAVSPRPIV